MRPALRPVEERVEGVDIGDERLSVSRITLAKRFQDFAVRTAVASFERLLRSDEVGFGEAAVDEVSTRSLATLTMRCDDRELRFASFTCLLTRSRTHSKTRESVANGQTCNQGVPRSPTANRPTWKLTDIGC